MAMNGQSPSGLAGSASSHFVGRLFSRALLVCRYV